MDNTVISWTLLLFHIA